MVTAPMRQQGFAVSLPQARQGKPLSTEPLTVTVPASFHQDSRLQINDSPIPLTALLSRIRIELQTRASKDVFLRADGAITYADYMRVVDVLTEAGVQNLKLATQPPQTDR
jgi:biopolymer transport protein TolR